MYGLALPRSEWDFKEYVIAVITEENQVRTLEPAPLPLLRSRSLPLSLSFILSLSRSLAPVCSLLRSFYFFSFSFSLSVDFSSVPSFVFCSHQHLAYVHSIDSVDPVVCTLPADQAQGAVRGEGRLEGPGEPPSRTPGLSAHQPIILYYPTSPCQKRGTLRQMAGMPSCRQLVCRHRAQVGEVRLYSSATRAVSSQCTT